MDSFYVDNAVIPVPSQSVQQTKTLRVFLDSRYRDVARYPNSSSFVIDIDEPIENVLSAKLVNFKIPSSSNMISKANNVLMFTEDVVKFAIDGAIMPFDSANVRTITIPTGNYQPADLAAQIQNLINAVAKATVTVTYDTNSQQFSFRSDLVNRSTGAQNLGFSLLFTSPMSCARIMGFYDNTIYYGALSEPVTVYYNNNIVTTNVFDRLAAHDPVVLADSNYVLANGIAAVDVSSHYVQLTNVSTNNIFNGSLNHGKVAAPAKFMPLAVVNNDYVLLEIDQFSLSMLPSNQPASKAFAILSSNFAYAQRIAPYERTFTPALTAIKRFKLNFKNFDGQLCDFENNENFVELLLTVEKHPRAY